MKDLYEIIFVSCTDCFLHLNEGNIRKLKSDCTSNSYSVLVEFGENFSQCVYSSVQAQYIDIGNNYVGISSHFAACLGLKEQDEILISSCNAEVLESIQVRPCDDAESELINNVSNILENDMLNQINIVCRDQVIPIVICGNITVALRIEKLRPDLPYGRLQKCGSVLVLDRSVSPDVETSQVAGPNGDAKLVREDFLDYVRTTKNVFSNFIEDSYASLWSLMRGRDPFQRRSCLTKLSRKFLGSRDRNGRGSTDDDLSEVDKSEMSKIFQRQNSRPFFRVRPAFEVEDAVPQQVRDKYVFARNHPAARNVFGPCSFKVLCKISEFLERGEGSNASKNRGGERKPPEYTYAYVVSFHDKEAKLDGNDLYCPEFVVKRLKIRFGSFVQVEEVKRTTKGVHAERVNVPSNGLHPSVNSEIHPTDTQRKIYEMIIKTVIDNIKFRQNINTLVLGNARSGKTYLLREVSRFLEDRSLFFSTIDCKTLRKSKVKQVRKVLTEKLAACSLAQPSVLLIDDLDALVVSEEETDYYNMAYTECVGNTVVSVCSRFQKSSEITVVATAPSVSSISCMSTSHGPAMFENILEIDDLLPGERTKILERLISQRFPRCSRPTFVEEIGSKTKGYNVQDLADLVEFAALQSHLRNRSNNMDTEISKADFEKALAEKVPLSLLEVKLNSNITTTWDDVGGMNDVKNLLTEMFSWPLRYPEIFSTCPLRHQCGVLLYGAPGTGKTLIAGAVANECGLNFISIKGPEIFSKYVGASEEGVRNLFVRARRAQPCLLFFDEFDSLAPRRGESSSESVTDRVVNQMLTELDGVEELSGVFVLAATSRPDLLDPALLRPGRIDKVVHCDIPKKADRVAILTALTKAARLSDDVDFEEIAERTDGFTGADLHAVLYAAQTALVKELEKESATGKTETDMRLSQRHLLIGVSETKPSLSKKNRTKYNGIYERFINSRAGRAAREEQERKQIVIFS